MTSAFLSEPFLWGLVILSFALFLSLVVLTIGLTAWDNYAERRRIRQRELAREWGWENR